MDCIAKWKSLWDTFHARHEVLLVICGAINCSSRWHVSWDKHCAWTAGTEFLVWNKTATFGHVSKNERFWISSLLMLRAHCWLNYLLTVPGGRTLILAVETSEFQQRKTAEMDWNRVVWLECDAVSVIRLYMPLDCCMYPWNACGNKHHVVFLLAMNAVCCAWRDLLGSAFPGAEVSAPEPHKTSQPHTTHAAPTGFIAPVKQMLLE